MEKNKNDYNKLTESSPKSKSDPNFIFLIISIVCWVLYLTLA